MSWLNPLPVLKELILDSMENLNGLFDSEAVTKSAPPPTIFSSLRRIIIRNCPKIKKLLPITLYLQNLKVIEISYCEQLEQIMVVSSSSSSSEEEKEATGISRINLPKLETLELVGLSMLRRVCGNTSRLMICDSLFQLYIKDCKELKRLPLHLPQSDNGQLYLPPVCINVSEEWWESLEWDQPSAKDALSLFCSFIGEYTDTKEEEVEEFEEKEEEIEGTRGV